MKITEFVGIMFNVWLAACIVTDNKNRFALVMCVGWLAVTLIAWAGGV